MIENLSGNSFAQGMYKELVTDRNQMECVRDFCQCDCESCIERRNELDEILEDLRKARATN